MLKFAAPSLSQDTKGITERTVRNVRRTASNFYQALDNQSASQYPNTGNSETILHQKRVEQLRDALRELDLIEDGWDSYDAPRPSSLALTMAWQVFATLREEALLPDRILPSAEGGVAFIFSSLGDRRATIENLNNGEDFLLLYDTQGSTKTLEWNWRYGVPENEVRALREHLKGLRLAAPRNRSRQHGTVRS